MKADTTISMGWFLILVLLGSGLTFFFGISWTKEKIEEEAQKKATWNVQQYQDRITNRILSVNTHAPVANHYRNFPEWLTAVEAQTGVDYRLLLAIAEVECGYEIECTSERGALGPFQLMPATAQAGAKALGIPYTPERIKWGSVRGVRAPLRIELGTAGDLQSALRIAAWFIQGHRKTNGITDTLLIYAMGEGGFKAAKLQGRLPWWYSQKVLDRYVELVGLLADGRVRREKGGPE